MGTQHNSHSEVAKFLQRWDEEMDAIRQGLNGYAVTARHDFVSRRMQNFADVNKIELMYFLEQQCKQNTLASSDTPK
jgi:hypothetical protein